MQSSDDFYRRNINRLVDEVKADIDEQLLAEADTEVKRQTGLLSRLAWVIPYLLKKYSTSVAKEGYRTFIERFITRNEERAQILSLITEKEKKAFAENVRTRVTGEAMATGAPVVENVGVRMRGRSPEMKAIVSRNVALITSVPEQYLDQVREAVLANHVNGGSYRALEDLLIDRFGVAKSRANLIARDQTNKLLGTLAKERQLAANRQYYQWMPTLDDRTRDQHKVIAARVTPYGKGIYKWNERGVTWAPVSKDGEYIEPGQDYQCRCTAAGLEE